MTPTPITQITPTTPIDPSMPRVLIHARGRMIASECAFWDALRVGLRSAGHELMLIGHHWAKAPLDVPLLRVRNGLDSCVEPWPQRGWAGWTPPVEVEGAEALLERERLWAGPELDDRKRARRRDALGFFQSFYACALAQASPRLCVIWNGHHPQEMILASLCRRVHIPVVFVERGPWPGTIHPDPAGVLADTTAARQSDWSWSNPAEQTRWRAVFDAQRKQVIESAQTWWAQPSSVGPGELRARLDIPDGATVILFAGQVDADIQNLLHAFTPGNVEAFDALLAALPSDRSDLFILGKHHPKSDRLPSEYRGCIARHQHGGARWKAVWADDVSIADALRASDRVVAVNSTVIFEGLLSDLPCLQLGRSLLSGKGIVHEVGTGDSLQAAVGGWLDNTDHCRRQDRFADFAAHLLARHLFSMDPAAESLRGPADLARVLAEHTAANEPDLSALPPGRAFLEEVGLWDEARDHPGRLIVAAMDAADTGAA